MIDSIAAEVVALAEFGLYPVRLHYPIFKDGKADCSCGNPECPDNSRGKHPVASSWGRAATRDTEIIQQQFSGRPWNVGIIIGPCHGIPESEAIIDIEDDSPEGRKLAEMLLEGFPCPQYTSGKSIHRLYRWTSNLPPVANLTVRGLEFRFGGPGKETQSVAPPSKHHSGRDYEWIEGCSLYAAPITPLPGHVVEYLLEEYARQQETKSTHPSSVSTAKFRAPGSGKITPGGRHHALLREANKLWRYAYNLFGINGLEEQSTIDQVWMWLAGANQLVCDPPKSDRELQVILESSAAFMRGEILKELSEAEQVSSEASDEPVDTDGEAEGHSFGSYLRRYGIRKRYDPTIPDQTVASPERIDEWVCDWGCEIVSKGDEPTIGIRIGEKLIDLTLPEFEMSPKVALRIQTETNGDYCVNRTFAFWDWKTIWLGRPNDKKGQKGITRGLREHLLNKAKVVERVGLTLDDQVDEIVMRLAGPFDPLVEALNEWNSRGRPFYGRLKKSVGSDGINILRAPEDPLTGWYSTEDGIVLYVKNCEVTKQFKSVNSGMNMPARRIAESLVSLGFAYENIRRGGMSGRWYIRKVRKNVEQSVETDDGGE